MLSNEFGQFLLSVLIFMLGVLLVNTVMAPLDPFSQLLTGIAALPIVLAGSYYLVYTLGIELI